MVLNDLLILFNFFALLHHSNNETPEIDDLTIWVDQAEDVVIFILQHLLHV